MAPVHHEKVFEDAIESALLRAGWLKGANDLYDHALGLNPEELLDFVRATQLKEWERLVTAQAGDEAGAARRLAEQVAKAIDSEGALEVLRHGVKDRGITFRMAYFRPAHTIAADALEPYGKNTLSVVRQFRYSAKTTDALDLALFVNGIPVATAELKNQLTGQDEKDARRQYREDRDPQELLFAKRALVHFAVDPNMVFVTTRLAGKKTRFLPFNMGTAGAGNAGGAGNPEIRPGGTYQSAYLWERIWHPDTWLDLLKRFLHVDDEDVKKGKGRRPSPGKAHRLPLIFPRFHQWHAVQTMTGHAKRHGAGHNYLVQHSAGSGKSNTIAWLAHALSSLHTPDSLAEIDESALVKGYQPNQPVFHKVIVITDRVVLDRQLQETIYQFEHTPGVVKRIPLQSSQLADALQGESARIIITTLQKFPYILQQVEGLRGKRFAVIVDEAHSSQSGEGAALKRVLLKLGSDDVDEEGDLLTASALARGRHDNLSYFAFTATPKSKTLTLFGVEGEDGKPRAFHPYSMRQAIEEGFRIDDLIAHHRPLPVVWAAAIAAQICAVLTVAHAESLIHRDLKPTNLVLCADGTVKVLDFGIVAVLGSADITQITRAGEGVGTPYYMSPELAVTGEASAQSDLYALGCVLHELLTGSRVFESAHTVAEISRHYSEAPPRLRSLRPDVPGEIERLVLDLLAKNAADRPSGAAEVYQRLLPFVVALPPLLGTTTVAPSPDPLRMYATVVERIADTAFVGPRVPAQRPEPVRKLSEAELLAANERAEELAVEGRFSQAIELLEGALAGAEEVLSQEHPMVFALRMRLADSRFAARDYRRATEEYFGLLPELAGMLGAVHPAVLGCRLNQALCSAALRQTKVALSQMGELLGDARPALGDRDPFTLELRREFATLLAQLGDHEQARSVLRPLVPDMAAVYGDGHPETRHVRDLLENLARLLE